jgi:hypothetical protein
MQTRSKKPTTRLQGATLKGDDFVTVARRLEANEDKAKFEAMLGKIARGKPAPKALSSKRRKK